MPTVAQQYGQVFLRAEARGAHAAPVVLMVSGGADSTALLIMACTSRLDIADGRGLAQVARERLHVLHVNHHLRGVDSDADEAFVRELCGRFGLPLCVEHASFDGLDGQNLEAAAREVRYAAARRYVRELSQELGTPRSQARILTAHTASDRAETFFMNAIKGSGPAGLSSIPRRRNIIVRPLIEKTHEELCHYLEVAGESWREDETNKDTSYLRNFVRHKVMPLARERNGNVERTVGAACDILGDEDAFMAQLAATALRSCVRKSEEGLLVLDGARLAAAEVAIARRMVRVAVKQLDPEARLEMRHVEGVLAIVAAGSGSRTLPAGIDARMEFGALSIRTPAAREEFCHGWLMVPGTMALANQCVMEASFERIPAGESAIERARQEAAAAPADTRVLFADASALGYAAGDISTGAARVWVDAYEAGDVMCPLGMQGRSKKVSDILNEAKVPVVERKLVPVVRTAPGCAIVWLAGIRADERFCCTASTVIALKIVMRPVGATGAADALPAMPVDEAAH